MFLYIINSVAQKKLFYLVPVKYFVATINLYPRSCCSYIAKKGKHEFQILQRKTNTKFTDITNCHPSSVIHPRVTSSSLILAASGKMCKVSVTFHLIFQMVKNHYIFSASQVGRTEPRILRSILGETCRSFASVRLENLDADRPTDRQTNPNVTLSSSLQRWGGEGHNTNQIIALLSNWLR